MTRLTGFETWEKAPDPFLGIPVCIGAGEVSMRNLCTLTKPQV